MDSTKRWNGRKDTAFRVPLYLLAERPLEDQFLPVHAYLEAQEMNDPDEHTTDPGVGAADSYCVFQIGEEPEEDDE